MPSLPRNVLPQPGLIAHRVKENLLQAEYRFAKTMPENPHWYTLRKTWADDAAFRECVGFMREFGYTEIFKGRKYTMFNLNGYKYWTMGAPIDKPDGTPCTILINRARINEPADYDLIAHRYDDLFTDSESQRENREIFRLIRCRAGDRVLDIGCGTGLFLEYFRLRLYLGLDPSAKMLRRLEGRFGPTSLCNSRFEEFHDDGDGFDLIVSLFGAVNYIDPAGLDRVFEMLRPGGRIFAMFYQERYVPVTYEKCGVAFPHYLTSEYDLSKFTQTLYKDTYLIAEYAG